MPRPPPEPPHLRLLKGNPGKRRTRVPPEPSRADECPLPPRHLNAYIHVIASHRLARTRTQVSKSAMPGSPFSIARR
jgi:hypothetical protein